MGRAHPTDALLDSPPSLPSLHLWPRPAIWQQDCPVLWDSPRELAKRRLETGFVRKWACVRSARLAAGRNRGFRLEALGSVSVYYRFARLNPSTRPLSRVAQSVLQADESS